MIESVTRFATNRRVTVAMLAIGFVLFGFIAMSKMPVTLLPNLEYPTLTIRTEYDNTGPEEMELLITKPLEESVGVVKGLNKIYSTSTTGRSDVKLQFNWDADMKQAAYDVRDRMDAVQLPLDVDSPILLRFNPSTDPILQLSLSLDGSGTPEELKRLRTFADNDLKKKLDPVAGVAAVKISGGYEKEIEILPDQFKLSQLGLSISDISARLRQDNINLSGGAIKQGSKMFLVRTVNQFENIAAIKELIISNANDRIIKIKDVAEVKLGHKDRKSINRLNGKEAIEIAIYKEGDGNTVEVANAVEDRLKVIRDGLPEGASIEVIDDQSAFIEDAIDNVISAAMIGGILAVLIIYLFLKDALATAIIAVLIPISVITGFFFMYRAGVSFNIMSLGGIALAVGLLVDNGIVVLENIASKLKLKSNSIAAIREGTAEVGGAITASTLTTIAVFLPLVFVEGISGQLFRDQALTVTFTLIVSLVFALIMIPMLSSLKHRKGGYSADRGEGDYQPRTKIGSKVQAGRKRFFNVFLDVFIYLLVFPFALIAKVLKFILAVPAAVVNSLFNALAAIYRKALPWALNNRLIVMLLATACFASGLWVLPKLGVELIPDMDANTVKINFKLPEGETLESTDAFFKKISKEVEGFESVTLVYGYSGEGNLLDTSALSGGENTGQITLKLKSTADKQRVQSQVLESINATPGLQSELKAGQFFDLAKPIEVEFIGNDLELLKENAQKFAKALKQKSYLINIDDGVEVGNPEVQLYFDHEKISALGMNVSVVANTVVDKVLGKVETTVNWQDQKMDLRVRATETQRDSIEDIRNLIINPESDASIRLSDVAEVRVAEGPGFILRRNQDRTVVVSADVSGAALGDAVQQVRKLLNESDIHPLVMTKVTGQNEDLESSNQSMIFALSLAVFLVYMILASQFESFIHPFVILFSVPLAFIGAVWALYISGTSISVVVFIGLIMLAGIVVNNAIVLIDIIKQSIDKGVSKTQAIIEAGQSRIRPIIMTTMTTVLGLLPMVITFGSSTAGTEIRAPMAITVIGGLLVSTLLTLIVIPVMFSLLTREQQNLSTED
ncbi:efflux RND transporter permease subunit [Marinicella sp. S1101]|uniref:efflux RND transporter permease subunit n=1 Tax=Marinicella marina TaxID=2996016 RepID=UPI00226096B6|nr:efflux RND transporter permease subunit [Marinicella marina]MCX7554473.1 efflux RND transporter permease subunit [Marinicella marina]MDJ1140624.1 efflux RND transporter permease subunit [Marinicella marina]